MVQRRFSQLISDSWLQRLNPFYQLRKLKEEEQRLEKLRRKLEQKKRQIQEMEGEEERSKERRKKRNLEIMKPRYDLPPSIWQFPEKRRRLWEQGRLTEWV